MAADAAMLKAVAAGGTPTMRWYRWSEPTISLGRFQEDDPQVEPSLPRVRRQSGGGAIRHDREWTYAIAIRRDGPLQQRPGDLYRIVHAAIIETIAAFGLALSFRGVPAPDRDAAFLCYLRGDANDLLLPAGTKVVGSAQRRSGGAILQHGSILWHKPAACDAVDGVELHGVGDLTSRIPPIAAATALLENVSEEIAEALGLAARFGTGESRESNAPAQPT